MASTLSEALRLHRKPLAPPGADSPQVLESVWAARLNGKVLPEWLTIYDDPAEEQFKGAPLAGHYPCLRLGPAWWFHDSPEGMRRFRRTTTETAGFYNTVGFNDDTRAFLSIPARHDVARRIDCGFLAELVAEHRLELDEAHEVARALAYDLAKQAYRL